MNNQTNEIWKPVVGYEKYYEVSNLGRVKRLERSSDNGYHLKEKIIKSTVRKKDGYCVVALCGNTYYLHRVVAEAFIPNPNKLPEVNHKDERKQNCCVENLEWCDSSYNLRYGTRAKRSAESRGIAVRNIDTNNVYPSATEAAKQLNANRSSITACCIGRQKTHHNQHWAYEEDYQNMIAAKLLERVFLEIETEVEPEVTVNGIQLDDFLATPLGLCLSAEAAAREVMANV